MGSRVHGRRGLMLVAMLLGCEDDGSSSAGPEGSTATSDATTTLTAEADSTPTTTTTATSTSSGPDETGNGSSSTGLDDTSGEPACVPGRTELDRPDDTSLPQVRVIYALPSDGVDRGYDTDGTLAGTVAVWNAWLAQRTGGPALRLDTCSGELDVGFFPLEGTDAEIAAMGAFVRDEIEAQMGAAGALHPNKLYAVYYDGTSTYACGGGAWPPSLVGRVGAMYLRGVPPGAPPCPQAFAQPGRPAGYLEHAMLHEVLHTMGLAAECATTSDGFGHTTDAPIDLMYAGPRPWAPSALDPGHDDYWLHGDPTCLDLAGSALLEPTPPDPWLPAGW